MDFTPPAREEIDATPPPSYRLFDGNAVGIATFLGTVFAGSIVIALNEFKLQRSGRGIMVLGVGFVFTVVYTTIAFLAPDSLSALFNVLNIGIAVGMYKAADSYFASDFEAHTNAGGETGMRWWAAGIGLVIMIVVVVIMFTAIFLSQGFAGFLGYDGCLSYQNGTETVCYNEPIKESEAQCTMDYFAEKELFTGNKTWSTFLEDKGTINLSMVIEPDLLTPEIEQEFSTIRAEVQDRCFGNLPVRVDLIDENMSLVKSLTP